MRDLLTSANWRLLALTILLFARPLAAAHSVEYQYQKIVDSIGAYKSFTTSYAGPSLNDNGDVIFVAELDNGHRRLELWTPDGIQTFASSNGLSPYRTNLFAFAPIVNNHREVIFYAVSFATGSGIFTGPNPTTDLVADQSGSFNAFGNSPVINDAGNLVFRGTLPGGTSGLYRGADPVADKIVDSTGAFASFSQFATNNNDDLLFVAFLDGGSDSGVFTGADPVTDRLVDSTGIFKAFQAPRINLDGDVIFQAELDSGVTGLYTGPDPVADKLVDSSDGFEHVAGGWINDSDEFVFGAIFDGGKIGIFSGPDPVADKIIATGDALYGSTITALSSLKGLNNAGQIVFGYALENGEQGIVIGTPLTAGDFNNDNIVDAADYTRWRDTLDQTGLNLPADSNGNGTVDFPDYTLWKSTFGNILAPDAASEAAVVVPEPTTIFLVSILLLWAPRSAGAATRSLARVPRKLGCSRFSNCVLFTVDRECNLPPRPFSWSYKL